MGNLLRRVIPCVLIAVALCARSDVSAHMGPSQRVDVEADGGLVTATVRWPILGVAVTLGLGADAGVDEVVEAAGPLALRLRDELVFADAGGWCQPLPPRIRAETETVRFELPYRCSGSAGLTVADRSLASGGGLETRVVFVRGDERTLRVLRDPTPVSLTSRHWLSTSVAFVEAGAVHLVTGYDHLLFLLTLVVGVGWVARRKGRRFAFMAAARVVTAFTVGHSLTLALAVLGAVDLPPTLVEATIALSIVLAAALNVVRPDAAAGRSLVALGFGLIHGFGFSSVLAEVGLPAGQRALALLSFNLGIEVAQLTLVLVVLVPLAELAQRPWYRPVVTTFGSCLAALCGLIWFAERTSLL